jgi:succinate dehydrogenase/fumarate reductase flavoprotein subunit
LHNLPHLSVDYPELPGSSGIRTNILGSVVNDSALWRFLKKAVVARKERIDCWYSSPVTALIQDPKTKAVVGVEVERGGKKLNIAARKAVVLAPGGFENNPSYTQQFIGYPRMLPVGTLANEGDGIRMAQAAGARLWHMNAWESGGVGLAPEQDRIRSIGTPGFFRTGSCILVGKDAKRYIAEDKEQRHGRVLVGGTWVVPARPDQSFFIFDEGHRQAVLSGKLKKPFPHWSEGFEAEIASGKIAQGETIEALAASLSLDADALRATIEAFGQGAAKGQDPLGREGDAMKAFQGGPYYGIAVFPSVLATRGGPERTARSEVVDTKGVPIPHLYSAGEFGGITARGYQGGDGMSECVVFGKIAGDQAASEESLFVADPVEGGLGPGSGDASLYDMVPDESLLDPGESWGIAVGLGGPIWVKVASEKGAVKGVTVIHQSETPEVGAPALEVLAKAMVDAKSYDVDLVSGATVTSLGFKAAVAQALAKAGQG